MIPLDIAVTYATGMWASSWVDGIVVGGGYLSYPIFTWHRLDQLLAGERLFERTLKGKVAVAVMLLVVTPLIAGLFPEGPLNYLVAAIFLFALLFILSLPAKQLKSIELKRNAGIWEYVPDTFNFFMWPSMGVFFLQTRINRLLQKRIVIEE